MFITQLSIFLENRQGSLSAVLKELSEHGIDIKALCIAEAAEYGIVRMIVNDPDLAKKCLADGGFVVKCNDVFVIPMDDKPGGLRGIVDLLTENGISIEYLYAFVAREENKAKVVLRVDKQEKASELFGRMGF